MENLTKEQIIRDVLDLLPTNNLSIQYPNNVKVLYGNQLKINHLACEPDLSWDALKDKYYTICLTDPDAPNRQNPIMKERVHWLVANIPSSQNWRDGLSLIDYVPSCPPQGSGLHRYTFVLYEHSKLDFSSYKKIDTSKELWDLRRAFSVKKFAQKYNLGDAFAANFYVAEWDEDAQITRDKLGL